MDNETFQALLLEKTQGVRISDLSFPPGSEDIVAAIKGLEGRVKETGSEIDSEFGYDTQSVRADITFKVPEEKTVEDIYAVAAEIFHEAQGDYAHHDGPFQHWRGDDSLHTVYTTKLSDPDWGVCMFVLSHNATFSKPLPEYAELFAYVGDGGSPGLEPAAKQVYDFIKSVDDPDLVNQFNTVFGQALKFYLSNPDRIGLDFDLGVQGNPEEVEEVTPYLEQMRAALQTSARAILGTLEGSGDQSYQILRNTEKILGAMVMGMGGDIDAYTRDNRAAMRQLRYSEN